MGYFYWFFYLFFWNTMSLFIMQTQALLSSVQASCLQLYLWLLFHLFGFSLRIRMIHLFRLVLSSLAFYYLFLSCSCLYFHLQSKTLFCKFVFQPLIHFCVISIFSVDFNSYIVYSLTLHYFSLHLNSKSNCFSS